MFHHKPFIVGYPPFMETPWNPYMFAYIVFIAHGWSMSQPDMLKNKRVTIKTGPGRSLFRRRRCCRRMPSGAICGISISARRRPAFFRRRWPQKSGENRGISSDLNHETWGKRLEHQGLIIKHIQTLGVNHFGIEIWPTTIGILWIHPVTLSTNIIIVDLSYIFHFSIKSGGLSDSRVPKNLVFFIAPFLR